MAGREWETRSYSRPSPRSFDSATHGPRSAGHRHPSYERGLKWKASDGLLWRNSAGFFHFRHAEDKDEHPLAQGLVFWSGVAGACNQSRWLPLGPLNPGTIDNTGGVPLPRARRQSFLLQDCPECVAALCTHTANVAWSRCPNSYPCRVPSHQLRRGLPKASTTSQRLLAEPPVQLPSVQNGATILFACPGKRRGCHQLRGSAVYYRLPRSVTLAARAPREWVLPRFKITCPPSPLRIMASQDMAL